MAYVPVIGLEVHAQLLTRSKAFCSCPNDYGASPNVATCPICLGLPGTLPVLNRTMVELALRLALATNCTIRFVSQFARKNYFYPDLPKGYQISQFDQPLAQAGSLDFEHDGLEKKVSVRRIHLEEDAGKSFHLDTGHSLVDFNRCGVPLIEIVSEPELTSPEEARAYLEAVRRMLQYLEICSGDMEKGALRCDANVSLKDPHSGQFGIPTEVKNLNSFRGVQRALAFEIERQTRVLESGGTIVRETLLWDDARGEARPMRSKELAHDYRYFPEPDLVLLEVNEGWLQEVQRQMPELPKAKEQRFVRNYSLTPYQAKILCQHRPLADYFERCVHASGNAVLAANFILTEILHTLNETNQDITQLALSPERLAGLLRLVDQGQISGSMAKELFPELRTCSLSAEDLVQQKGWRLIRDDESLVNVIRQVLQSYPEEVKRYHEGRTKLFGFFMGKLMEQTQGQADPVTLRQMLEKELQTRK